MKTLKNYINESLLNESSNDKYFIDAIIDIIDNTDSIETFNKKCEQLWQSLSTEYDDVEVNNKTAVDIEKGAVYCYLLQFDNSDIHKSAYGQDYALNIGFGLTGGSVSFDSSPLPSYVRDKACIICGSANGDGINLIDHKASFTQKDVYKDSFMLKKIGKTSTLKKFVVNLRKQATKW